MQPIGIWTFLWRTLYKAAANTAHFFGLDVKTILITVFLFGLGYYLHYRIKGAEATKQELSTVLVITVAPFVLFFSGLFIYNCVKAPYLLYVEEFWQAQNQVEAAKLAQRQAENNASVLQKKVDELENAPHPPARHAGAPASTPLDDKRKSREALGVLLMEGQTIQIRIVEDQNISYDAELRLADGWAAKAEKILLTDLGPEYVARFRSSAGLLSFSPAKPIPEPNAKEKAALWGGLNNRLTRLNQFLEELKP